MRAFETATSLSSVALRRAAVDAHSPPSRAFAQIVRLARRRSAPRRHSAARCRDRRPSRRRAGARRAAALCCRVAALEVGQRRASQARIFRRRCRARDLAVFQNGDMGGAGRRHFVQAVAPCTTQALLGAELAQHLAQAARATRAHRRRPAGGARAPGSTAAPAD